MQDINLYHLFKFYVKNWIWIILISLTALSIGFIYCNFVQTPMYKSQTTLLLIRSSAMSEGSTQDTILINNYIELFKSRRVLEPVIKSQRLNVAYEDMVGNIEASNSKSTEVIKVAVSTTDPKKSKAFLEAAVTSFKAEVKLLYKLDNVKVVDSASMDNRPYNINKPLTTSLSALIGFILTIIAMFFIYDYRLIQSPKKELEEHRITDEAKELPAKFPVIPDIPMSNKDDAQPEFKIEDVKVADTLKPVALENVRATSTLSLGARRARDRLIQTSYARDRYSRH